MLYCFWEIRYFVWKIENFGKLQLRWTLVIFVEILHMFPTYQCLQKVVRVFFYFDKNLSYLPN